MRVTDIKPSNLVHAQGYNVRISSLNPSQLLRSVVAKAYPYSGLETLRLGGVRSKFEIVIF